MVDNIKNYEKTSIATSLLLVIFSMFLIFKPEASLNFVVILIGAFLTLVGIIHMISYFTSNKEFKAISTELISGTLYAIIGLFLIFKPTILNEFLAIIVGAWLVIQFIIKFQFAFNLKSVSSPTWSLILISSFFHLVFGLVMLFNPFASIVAVTTVAGIILLVSQVGNIAESIYLLVKG